MSSGSTLLSNTVPFSIKYDSSGRLTSQFVVNNKLLQAFHCFTVHFSIQKMDKTPTHALFTQHYISLAC